MLWTTTGNRITPPAAHFRSVVRGFAFIALLGGFISIGTGAAQAQADVALGKPVTASSWLDNLPIFAPNNITNGLTTDGVQADGSYWLSAYYENSATATIDLGRTYEIASIALEDTHNGTHNDCGTQDFRIGVSRDGVSFTTVVTSSFTNTEWANDTWQTLSIPAADVQYIRFYADSCYGPFGIVGLTELEAFQATSTPEPSGIAMLAGFGIAGAGVFAKRRRARG